MPQYQTPLLETSNERSENSRILCSRSQVTTGRKTFQQNVTFQQQSFRCSLEIAIFASGKSWLVVETDNWENKNLMEGYLLGMGPKRKGRGKNPGQQSMVCWGQVFLRPSSPWREQVIAIERPPVSGLHLCSALSSHEKRSNSTHVSQPVMLKDCRELSAAWEPSVAQGSEGQPGFH